MNPEFWQNRWDNNQIGWHQPKVNPKLMQFFDTLQLNTGLNTGQSSGHSCSRILVPLCGKTLDIGWLAKQGLDVVGIELAQPAVEQLFEELEVTPDISKHGKVTHYHAQYAKQHIDIWQGDIFDMSAEPIGQVDAIYDRAGLVALPDDAPDYLRTRYAQQLIRLSGSAKQLLLTFDLNPETHVSPPPFIVTPEMLQCYYGQHYQIELLDKVYADKITSQGTSGYFVTWLLAPL
ncbi:thiopurine S-methyltransferase [Psychrobacter sp. I-STPA10]|uniref:thiopurine S-methyltransferase n=1 Tax=Psychrobacter sp. I-STPA10 TaxID=2585769 RepID=UPI001E570822|nr:thiopurine S-methyltransferase [Psychrobacter sp. I-STPA10]